MDRIRLKTFEKLGGRLWIGMGRAVKRRLKRLSAKGMRRMGKQLQDDAPKRLPIRGWID